MPNNVEVILPIMALDFGFSTGMDMKQAASGHNRNGMFNISFVLATIVDSGAKGCIGGGQNNLKSILSKLASAYEISSCLGNIQHIMQNQVDKVTICRLYRNFTITNANSF